MLLVAIEKIALRMVALTKFPDLSPGDFLTRKFLLFYGLAYLENGYCCPMNKSRYGFGDQATIE